MPAHRPAFVGRSPRRFVLDATTVLAGEPSAESFDRLPPRQLVPPHESWRLDEYLGWAVPIFASLFRSVPSAPAPNNGFLYSDIDPRQLTPVTLQNGVGNHSDRALYTA